MPGISVIHVAWQWDRRVSQGNRPDVSNFPVEIQRTSKGGAEGCLRLVRGRKRRDMSHDCEYQPSASACFSASFLYRDSRRSRQIKRIWEKRNCMYLFWPNRFPDVLSLSVSLLAPRRRAFNALTNVAKIRVYLISRRYN